MFDKSDYFQRELGRNAFTTLELVPESTIYLSAEVTGDLQPCEIIFDYQSEGKLKIFASIDLPAPNADQHHVRKYGRPEKLTIFEPMGKDQDPYKIQTGEKFTGFKVHLALTSESYLKVGVKYQAKMVNKLSKFNRAVTKVIQTNMLKSATEKISDW